MGGDGAAPRRETQRRPPRPDRNRAMNRGLLTGLLCAVAAQQLQVPALPSQTAGYVQYAVTNLPAHYRNGPVAATNNTPIDNPITDAGATLGRVLFYDKRLSHSDGLSCASCHKQENG